MKESTKNYIIGAIGVLTVINTILIFTVDKGGRVIQPANTNTALVTPAESKPEIKSFSPQDNQRIEPQAEQMNVPSGPSTTISFAEMNHDFGSIRQDSKNTYVFKFKNTGSNPLIIQNAQGSCGCTVPKYPKEPINPGGSGEIEVEYSPGKQEGNQSKTVTITANTEPNQTVLQIKANVEKI